MTIPSIDRRLAIRFRWMSLVEIQQSSQRKTKDGHNGKNNDHKALGRQISYEHLNHQRRPSRRHTISDATRDNQRKMADCTKTHKWKTTILAAVNASLCDICSVCLSQLFSGDIVDYTTHSFRPFDLLYLTLFDPCPKSIDHVMYRVARSLKYPNQRIDRAHTRSLPAMTTVAAVTRQMSALDLTSKKQPSSTKAQPVSTKAQPPTKAQPASTKAQPPPTKITLKPNMDIGKYDGGFELDNEKRGEKVYGEAAEALALDSSVSGYVPRSIYRQTT